MLSARPALSPLFALMLLVALVACQERDAPERHDVELDSTPADTAASDDGEPDGSADDGSQADTTPADTVVPPSDIDEGPRELLNGTPVRFGHVVDGDTLDVFVGDAAVKVYTVRLKGLASPECLKDNVLTEKFGRRYQCVADDELHGLAAWQALHDAVADKTGTVTCDDVAPGRLCPTDTFDRFLAYVEIDGRDLATEMAWYGHGFSYTAFTASKRAEICAAEYNARNAGRGIWSNRTLDQVMDQMSEQTRSWYYGHHDARCDAAIASP